METYPGRCIPLFTIDDKNYLHIFTVEKPPDPRADWTVISLILPERNSQVQNIPGELETTDPGLSC